MKKIVISSLILGLIGASGLVSAQTGSRDYGGSGSMSSGSASEGSSGRMQSGSGSEASTSGEAAKSGSTVGKFIDDATVTTRVKSRFAQDDQVSAMNIGVETNDGVVQLSGYAGSEAEKARAAEIASQVPDVRSVQNNITIRSEGGSTAPGSGTGSGSGSSGMGAGSSSSDRGSMSR